MNLPNSMNPQLATNMEQIKTYTFVNGDGQIIEVVSKQQVLKVIAEDRERIISIITNGGTGDTIAYIQHDGEPYVNERQLVKAIIKSNE